MKEKITKIYEQFRKPLLYFILKNVSNKNIAEDLLHEVFIKAYKNIDNLKEEEKIQSWLYKIARNTITDYFRKKRPTNIEYEDMFFEEKEEQSVLNELSCCLETLILQLPKNQRDVLEAVYFKEQTLIEYSNKSGINISTVKSHSKRAKEKMKKIFNECCTFQKNQQKQIVDYKYKEDKCLCENEITKA